MIDLSTYHEGFVAGFVPGLGLGLGLMKMAWEQSERRRRRPYSSAAIAFRATAEDAAKVRSKIVNPLAWEDPPKPIRRIYHCNPQTIAECGGPCEEGGPEACDCGAITWTDRPVKPHD